MGGVGGGLGISLEQGIQEEKEREDVFYMGARWVHEPDRATLFRLIFGGGGPSVRGIP